MARRIYIGIDIVHTNTTPANVMLVDKPYKRVNHECGILSSSTRMERFAPQRRVLVNAKMERSGSADNHEEVALRVSIEERFRSGRQQRDIRHRR